MKRILNTINKKSSSQNDQAPPVNDSLEREAVAGVKRFCESGGPSGGGDDVLHLPGIVEAAESSPSAAREAASQILLFLSKDYYNKPHVQYNGIMLVRILADNPGPTFTRNLDSRFAVAFKALLRHSQDPGLQQLARETLDALVTEKRDERNLVHLNEMWTKEKQKTSGAHGNMPQTLAGREFLGSTSGAANRQGNYFGRHHRTKTLPPLGELVGRIEEAKTSAKLLLQVVQSASATEILDNDLIREFSERCQSASRSVQGYIYAENPAPDNDTLQTLIETNDQLTMAMSKHQRAILKARKATTAQDPLQPSPPMDSPSQEPQSQDPFRDNTPTSLPSTLQVPLEPATMARMDPVSQTHRDNMSANATLYPKYSHPASLSQSQVYSFEPYHPGHTQARAGHSELDLDPFEVIQHAEARPYAGGAELDYQEHGPALYAPEDPPRVNTKDGPMMGSGVRTG